MENAAQWIAPAATMIAAVMTAANAGARLTGWGFVVFTIGSVGWIIVGMAGDQANLVATNGFLALVNAIGAWRWLGRQAAYDAVTDAAETSGKARENPTVFAATGVAGRPVVDTAGAAVGRAVDAIIDSRSAAITHLVVRHGGIGGVGETLVALPRDRVTFEAERIVTRLDADAVARLPALTDADWPRLLAR